MSDAYIANAPRLAAEREAVRQMPPFDSQYSPRTPLQHDVTMTLGVVLPLR